MGYKLYREIKNHAPDDWTAGERLIALIIADNASDRTRCSTRLSLLELMEQSGYSDRMIRHLLSKLGRRGFEFRVSAGIGKDGRDVFAAKGHAVDYRVPHMLKGGNRVPPLPIPEPVDNSPKGGNRVPQRRQRDAAPFPQTTLTTGVPVVGGAVEVQSDRSGQQQSQGGDVAAAAREALHQPMSKIELASWQVIESRRQRQEPRSPEPGSPASQLHHETEINHVPHHVRQHRPVRDPGRRRARRRLCRRPGLAVVVVGLDNVPEGPVRQDQRDR